MSDTYGIVADFGDSFLVLEEVGRLFGRSTSFFVQMCRHMRLSDTNLPILSKLSKTPHANCCAPD